MIWLTWRQQRFEALIGGLMALAVAVLVVRTGLDLRLVYRETGVAACLGSHAYDISCQPVLGGFDYQLTGLTMLSSWLNMLPLLFGILLAAPLALEMENGTYRLVWTQGIPRMTWLRARLLLIVAAAAMAGAAMGLLLTWWRLPANAVHGPFQPNSFDVAAPVFMAYTVFALAVGVAAGTLVRRTIPAVGISIAGFLVARLGIESWLRPHYVAPVARLWFTGHAPYSPLDWVVDKGDHWRDRAGHLFSYADVTRVCASPATAAAKDAYTACLRQHGFSEVVFIQPADRFWLFEGIEMAIFLVLSALLLAVATWWIRHRV